MAVYQDKDKNNKPIKTNDGRSWYFRCYYTDIHGNRIQKKSKKYYLKGEAEEEERNFLSFVSTETVVNYSLMFEFVYNDYFMYKSKKIKSTTVYDLKKKLDKHILAFFKPFKLHSIKINVINQWYVFLSKSATNLPYQNKIIGYLREILTYAKDNYDFDGKVVAKIINHRIETVDRIKASEWNFWTHDDFKKFISSVDNEFHYTMFSFLYYTGLRIGEMIALCWKDINFERKTIHIYKTYTNRLGNNTHKLVDPKTKNSIRIVDLDDDIINLLKKHYESEKNIYDFNDDMFIFGNVNPITPTTFARYLSYYIKKSGVKKITPHGFRHSHVSLLFHLGCDSRDIAARVGDTIQVIENTYYHMFPEKKSHTVNVLNNLKSRPN